MTTTVSTKRKNTGNTQFDKIIRHISNPFTFISYVILIFLTIIYVSPIATVIITAFKTNREFNRNPTALPENWFNFENFFIAWEQANFSQFLVNSALYAVAATTIYVITAVFLSFPLARNYIKGANWVTLLFVIALFLPPALIPQFQLILALGLYNNPIGYVMLLVTNPIGIIILVGYMKSLPRELDEAAAIDGCSYWRFMLTIVFPLSRPAIATVVVIHAIGIWNEVVLATIYLPNEDFHPATRGLLAFDGVFGGANKPALAAAVIIMTVPMVILFLFLQRYIVSGLTSGAVKS